MPANPYYELARVLLQYGHGEFLRAYEDYIENTYDGKRGEMNFIDQFLEYTKDAESPTSFFRWSAIAAISATLRDNVFWDAGTGRIIYPNLYVILVGKSAATRKGAPLKIAKKLVEAVSNTKIIAGRTSIQAAMRILAENKTQAKPGTGGYLLEGASGVLYTEELAAFLVDDKATVSILTDLYDYHDNYSSHLVSGDFKLSKTCVTMLAASNEHYLKQVYNKDAVYGGLLGRTVLVMESKRRLKNSGMFATASTDPVCLVDHLKKVARVKGKMEFEDEAKHYYDDWYNAIDDEDYSGNSGVQERIHTTIIKVAMCLAMAEKECVPVVKVHHIKEAMELCLGNLKNYEFLTMSTGDSKTSKVGPAIIKELLLAPNYTIKRSKLVYKAWGDVDFIELERVEKTLVEARFIKIVTLGGEPAYQLMPEIVEEYQKKRGC